MAEQFSFSGKVCDAMCSIRNAWIITVPNFIRKISFLFLLLFFPFVAHKFGLVSMIAVFALESFLYYIVCQIYLLFVISVCVIHFILHLFCYFYHHLRTHHSLRFFIFFCCVVFIWLTTWQCVVLCTIGFEFW